MLRRCTYTLLPGPSSHVILNALNLKAFICNRIITAGTVIRFAVSPKRIYSSRTGNVGAESRVHPGSRGLSGSVLQLQAHHGAPFGIETFDTNRDVVVQTATLPARYTGAIMVTTGRSLRRRIRFLSPAISLSSLPHKFVHHPAARDDSPFQSKSHTINHTDYKASTAGDCSLFWVLGDENFVSRGRVV